MANYFVLDSKFTPYTFDELIKPYQLYGAAYKEQEAVLDAAAEKEFTDNIKEGSIAETLFNTATGNLKSVSDELATKGLTPGIRNKVKSTARDYNRTMKTLTSAQKNLTLEKERRLKQGDKYRYKKEDLELDDFLNGNMPNTDSVNLDEVQKNVAVKALTRAKEISTDTWQKVFDNSGKYTGYYDIVSKGGLSTAQIDIVTDDNTYNNLMRDKNALGEDLPEEQRLSQAEKDSLAGLRKIIDDERNAIEYNEYNSSDRLDIDNAIATGMLAGVLEEKHQYKDDQNFISARDKYIKRGSGGGSRGGGGATADGYVNSFVDKDGNNQHIIKKGKFYYIIPDDAINKETGSVDSRYLNVPYQAGDLDTAVRKYTVDEEAEKQTKEKEKEDSKKQSFILYKKGHSLDNSTNENDFDKEDFEIRSFSSLNDTQKHKLEKELKSYGYNPYDASIDDDVALLYDRDLLGKSDYIIISKNNPDYQTYLNKGKDRTKGSNNGKSNNNQTSQKSKGKGTNVGL